MGGGPCVGTAIILRCRTCALRLRSLASLVAELLVFRINSGAWQGREKKKGSDPMAHVALSWQISCSSTVAKASELYLREVPAAWTHPPAFTHLHPCLVYSFWHWLFAFGVNRFQIVFLIFLGSNIDIHCPSKSCTHRMYSRFSLWFFFFLTSLFISSSHITALL